MSEIVWITFDEFKVLCFDLARVLLEYDEPIPDFSTRYPNLLESALEAPRQTFAGVELYSTFEKKASALFYFLNKGHCFKNGNKRIALTTLLVFLLLNEFWINATSKELYDLSIKVAESDPKHKDKVMSEIESFLNERIERVG